MLIISSSSGPCHYFFPLWSFVLIHGCGMPGSKTKALDNLDVVVASLQVLHISCAHELPFVKTILQYVPDMKTPRILHFFHVFVGCFCEVSFALREFRRLTSSHCPLKLSSDFWGHLRKPKCRSPYPLTRCWCSGLPGQALKPRSKKYNNCGLLGRLQQEGDSLWHLEAITKSIRFLCTVSTCQVCVSVILAYPNMNLPSKSKKKHSR